MRNTIKAKTGYRIRYAQRTLEAIGSPNTIKYAILYDGEEKVMIAELKSHTEYLAEKEDNECFNLCEVFTTEKGNQFIDWRDEELDQDYITKIPTGTQEETK